MRPGLGEVDDVVATVDSPALEAGQDRVPDLADPPVVVVLDPHGEAGLAVGEPGGELEGDRVGDARAGQGAVAERDTVAVALDLVRRLLPALEVIDGIAVAQDAGCASCPRGRAGSGSRSRSPG